MKPIFALAAVALALSASHARADIVWSGSAGDWGDASNWSSAQVPNIQNTVAPQDVVTINSGAVTYSGSDGDWRNNTTVTVSGPSTTWTQSSGNWLKIGDASGAHGTLNVNDGATFDAHNAGRTFLGYNGSGTLNISGGIYIAAEIDFNFGSDINVSHNGTLTTTAGVNLSSASAITANTGADISMGGDLAIYGHLSIGGDGTVVNIGSHEFQPKGGAGMSVSMSGGELDAYVVSFNGEACAMDFSGGTINVTNREHGIWAGAGGYLNFAPGSTGVFHVSNELASNAAADLLENGKIKFDNAVDPSAFTITPDLAGTGSVIALVAVVPEPASLSLLAVGAGAMLARRRRA